MKHNEQLAKEFNKSITRNLKKEFCWILLNFADLADMQLISTFIKGFRFLLCVVDILHKYVWVVPLKDTKDVSIVYAFQKIDANRSKQNMGWQRKQILQ